MLYSNKSFKAKLAAILVTFVPAQGTPVYLGRLTRPTIASAAIQTQMEETGFGGYRIVKKLSRPYAPLGGGRDPYPKLVFEDKRGRFWIAGSSSGGRVQLYDERTGVWETFSDRSSNADGIHQNGDALLPTDIAYICQSRDGTMWFSDSYFLPKTLAGGKNKLFLTSFDGKQWRSFAFATTPKCRIGLIQGTDGRVWSWAMDELRYWERGRWSEPTRVSEVLKGRASQFRPSLGRSATAQENVRSDRDLYEIIGAIQDRQGYLWLSTSSGVFTYNPRTSGFKEYPGLRDQRSRSMYEDHQGRVWFNHFFAVSMYDKSKGTLTSYNPLDYAVKHEPDDYPEIQGICQDERGRMIFACAEGLVILDEVENRWSFAATKGLGLDAEQVRNTLEGIVEDRQGRVWLAGYTGIAILAQ